MRSVRGRNMVDIYITTNFKQGVLETNCLGKFELTSRKPKFKQAQKPRCFHFKLVSCLYRRQGTAAITAGIIVERTSG